MDLLTPNTTYTMNGVTINEKIIPDGTRWTDAAKAKAAGFAANSLYKAQKPLCGTGKASFVTIHNTNDLPNVYDDGEQYTRATWPNQNMNSSRVHFYVDDVCAWQNLKAGTGLCSADPVGSAEVSWHAGDGPVATGGNMTSLSIEIIMGESTEHDAIAKDNGARIAAWLLWKNGLTIDALVTHTYWVNKSAGKTFADVDAQCTNPISGKKWCPSYIFGSSNAATAKKNWLAFKAIVKGYLDKLNGNQDETEGEGMSSYEQWKQYMQKYRQELRDNDSGDWSQKARQFVVDHGIFAGSGTSADGSPNYMWEDLLTREQCAQALYTFAQRFGLV